MPDNKCPNCGNPVGLSSSRCSFCGQSLPQVTSKPWISYVYHKVTRTKIESQEEVKLFICPFCSKKSLYRAPASSYYGCLNLECKAIGYSSSDVRNVELDGESIFVFRVARSEPPTDR